MTCEYTWPNHLLGSDRAAVGALVEQHRLQGDVAFGHSKLFIRSPQTLVALEQSRARLIPIIVLLLQKVWGHWGCVGVHMWGCWGCTHGCGWVGVCGVGRVDGVCACIGVWVWGCGQLYACMSVWV